MFQWVKSKSELMANKPETMMTTAGNPVAGNRNFVLHDITQDSKAVSN